MAFASVLMTRTSSVFFPSFSASPTSKTYGAQSRVPRHVPLRKTVTLYLISPNPDTQRPARTEAQDWPCPSHLLRRRDRGILSERLSGSKKVNAVAAPEFQGRQGKKPRSGYLPIHLNAHQYQAIPRICNASRTDTGTPVAVAPSRRRFHREISAASCAHSVRLQAVMQIAPSRALAAIAAILHYLPRQFVT